MTGILRTTVSLAAAVLLTLSVSVVASAQQASDIELDSPIRSFELGPKEVRVDLDVDLKNRADTRRLVKLSLVDIPEGWGIAVWNRFFDFKISELVVEPTEDTPGQRPRLRIALPDDRPAAGEYSFTLNVTSPDGRITYDTATFTITVPEQPQEEGGEVTLRSSFPVLRGPASSRYEFEIVIRNETGEERSFDLNANVFSGSDIQQGWEISFEPRFGESKIISSISVPDLLTENVNVLVRPPRNAAPGDYLIPVEVTHEDYEVSTMLQLTIVGRGEIFASTASGRLNVDATAGQEANAVLRLTNIGTGDLADINLLADTLPDWVIEFQVTTVESLPPNNVIDIPLTIKPPGDAVPGDYSITLRANHTQTNDFVSLRVTVTQSTIWGWLGIVLVVLVLGGLVGLFVRLGRR